MKFRSTLADLDRVQQSRGFKIVATCIALGAAIAICIAYGLYKSSLESPSKVTVDASEYQALAPTGDEAADKEAAAVIAEQRSAAEATSQIINEILSSKQAISGFVIGAGVLTALALVVIWLGLGLTYLGLLMVSALLAWLSILVGRGKDLGIASVGLVALIAAFTALMQMLRLAFAGTGPVMAIARNTLIEAVRMKVSLIFIVLMVFGLAALPLVLDSEQPLRYRIQSFLQFSTAGSFWLIALLVLTFSVASVATEQRDKVIWQTMTKPVAAWQYILGKWLGVVSIAAALLVVSSSGIFLFTEYLRSQPAIGESESYVSRTGQGLTEDRLIVETQVLTARTTVRPLPLALDEAQFEKNLQDRVESEMQTLQQTTGTAEELRSKRAYLRETISTSLRRSVQMAYRVIPPGQAVIYRFEGLNAAKASNRPVILRFKLESGANRPDASFKITVQFAGASPSVIPIGLGQFHTLPITPRIINESGGADLQVINGDISTGQPNEGALSFSPEGLEISYSSGGFQANFFRCVAVLWVKLGFLAMLAIAASTFLSFSVASLVSMAAFLAAEGAGFVNSALENYWTEDEKGNVLIVNTITAKIATVVGAVFKVYADLRPTSRLVEGIELSLGDVLAGTVVLLGITGILYAVAVFIFRKRELAVYSGN